MRSDMRFILDGNGTRRFHTVPLRTEQNIQRHSVGVAWFAALLTDKKPSANLLLAALAHDLAEHDFGDLPANVKKELGLKEQYHEMETARLREHGLDFALTETEIATLATADALDGVMKCLQELKGGNREPEVARCYNKWVEWMESGQIPMSRVAWELLAEISLEWDAFSEYSPSNTATARAAIAITAVDAMQIGGAHYQASKIPHWTWAAAERLDYMAGCITKYVARWKRKDGLKDLQKASHYLAKYIEDWEIWLNAPPASETAHTEQQRADTEDAVRPAARLAAAEEEPLNPVIGGPGSEH